MESPGTNTGVGCHALLQGIFLTQGLNPRLLHWQAGSSPLSHLGRLPGIPLGSKFKGLSETLVVVMVVLTRMLGRTGVWGGEDMKVNIWQKL